MRQVTVAGLVVVWLPLVVFLPFPAMAVGLLFPLVMAVGLLVPPSAGVLVALLPVEVLAVAVFLLVPPLAGVLPLVPLPLVVPPVIPVVVLSIVTFRK